MIDARTRPVGLLGWPVEHSRSPLIHNAAFASQGLPFCYVALAVEPEHIGAAVAGLRALGFAGSNVTVPHKEAVIPHLDVLSEAATAIGAVNTIVCWPDGSMYGDNTDAAGFLAPLLPQEHDLMGSEMVIFGAGGAARAAVYGLLTTFEPSRLTLAVRTPARAEALARDLAPHDAASALDVVPITEAGPAVASSRLLVNATSVGMTPHDTQSVWTTFEAHHLAYDLVYTPRRTRFLQLAEAAGAAIQSGLDMFVGQAAAAYVQWTGQTMPLDVVRRVLDGGVDASSDAEK